MATKVSSALSEENALQKDPQIYFQMFSELVYAMCFFLFFLCFPFFDLWSLKIFLNWKVKFFAFLEQPIEK